MVQKNLLVLFFFVAKRLKTKNNLFLGPFMRQLQLDLMVGVSPGSCFCEGKKVFILIVYTVVLSCPNDFQFRRLPQFFLTKTPITKI